jgi:hypothetical protein
LASWQLLIAGIGGSAALCGCEARVSRLLSGVVRLGSSLMNQSTPSRSIPLPLWVTAGFYPLYLFLWLGEGYFIWTMESRALTKNFFWMFAVAMTAFAVFGLLAGKPHGRRFAIVVGGVWFPAVGVIGLVVMARHGLQADDPPAWFVVLFCLVFILGGIWHWWALTRPAVRQWLALSQAKALPASSS